MRSASAPSRRALLAVVAAVLAAAGLSFAAGASAQPPSEDNPAGNVSGVVPVHGQAAKTSSSGANLVDHGGPVMATNKVVAVYWSPSSTEMLAYQQVIDGYFTDLVTDGSAQNVYAAAAQYRVSTPLPTAASSVVDTNPFPASGCSDTVAATFTCISDSQIQLELKNLLGSKLSADTVYFVFTPRGVGSCYSSSSCAFSQYCAYHSHFTIGSTVVKYANQPFTETAPSSCGTGQAPSGNQAADSTINVVSHEHNEAITDALGTAWYDRRGYENGDKCAWNFGTVLGGAAGAQFNQVINTHRYYLQQEWSNASSRCVLTGL